KGNSTGLVSLLLGWRIGQMTDWWIDRILESPLRLRRHFHNRDHPMFTLLDKKLMWDVGWNVNGIAGRNRIARAAFDEVPADFAGPIRLSADHLTAHDDRAFPFPDENEVRLGFVDFRTGVSRAIDDVRRSDQPLAGHIGLRAHPRGETGVNLLHLIGAPK